MFNLFVVPIHETYQIFFVKAMNINFLMIFIKFINKRSILYYHHPFSLTSVFILSSTTTVLFLMVET